MSELLLEILSEEIPARMQTRAAADLKRLVTDGLKDAGLEWTDAKAFATPRRLTLVVDGLPVETPDVSEERRGPRTDAPEKAINGFLGSTGLTLADLEKRETEKGEFYFAVIEKKGRPTRDQLPSVVEIALQTLPWPKSMRWADHDIRWVRPIHSILCLFAGEMIAVIHGPVNSGATTGAHRFLTDAVVEIKDFADYKRSLETGHVILDAEDRKARIKEGAEKLAAGTGLTLRDDPALLDEVAGLVEWPVPLMGSIDQAFMDVPAEVLTTTMRKNQKYFALENPDGTLASKFILVANKETPDSGGAIIAGNERVLRARLADAKFFWDQDRKHTLESRLPKLADITFHAKLGTLAEKMARVETLAVKLAPYVNADSKLAGRAAKLSKADLVTEMVYEFPEVQGIMGRYYALNDGEAPEVAQAIAEHYSPVGPTDVCPKLPVGVAVSIADKLDTLVGFWSLNEKPTGSKDPFALRRAALGIIRIVLEKQLRLKLRMIIELAWDNYPNGNDRKMLNEFSEDLRFFFFDRMKVHLRDQGIKHDIIDSLLAIGGIDDFVEMVRRASAVQEFLNSGDGANLLTAYRRAGNILRIEEKNDGASYDGALDDGGLVERQEKALHARLTDVQTANRQKLNEEDFAGAMANLARLRAPVDEFFDEVTVNCDDPALRVNRLKLLSRIRAVMNQVADFSQIEGGER